MSLEINLIILGFLVLLSGFFSSVELAIFSIGRLKLKRLVSSNVRNAKILSELKSNPQRLLITILIGNNFVNIGAASLATAVTLQSFPSEMGVAISTGIITFAILVFGEITPKSIALKHNELIALNSAPVLKFLTLVFMPLIFILEKITGFLVQIFGGDVGEHVLTEEEVKTVVALGAEEGAINKEEKEMIHRIFKFNDITAEDVMTTRSEIVGIEAGTKISDISRETLHEHSRLPVYKEDLDEIIGVFHVRDYLGSQLKDRDSLEVEKFVRPAIFIYETKKIDRLLKEFQKRKTHMAIVVDEYGGTVGIVTIEDLLEEIVGEIVDETDAEALIKRVRNNEFLVEGHASIERVNKVLGLQLKSEEFDTISGILISILDRVPQEQDTVMVGGMKIVVEKMDGPRVEKVRIFK